MRLFLSLTLIVGVAPFAAAQDLVAKTDAKSPADELKCFKLPPGFEAQLVASEPDIQKPMQLAFDAKNRLWVTTSYLYPFAAPEGKGTDKLFVLSDFGPDGKAKKVQVFDDQLNIPIGVLPLADGKSVIVSECGKILKLTDTDGDGKADKREVLFSGFGFVDTHGMTNSFTLMPDGWVYACHGFRNDSTVKGKDGHEVSMNSGHTFRFKTDGSRIEIFTRGQVNPFGMCVDPWLNLYAADCHSKPMTQLVRGAYYDSFGKPHDGLGYAPHVINHLHGSTGLCGIAYYAADHFPKEWRDVMFVGNVVTNRINCDKISWKGATPVGQELPDFLNSSDPWFRPVDIKLGPDGALYVSDFYNKIVGHYEVDLKHPGRDKDRGRIWRIVYKGKDGKGEPVSPPTELAAMTPLRALAETKELTAAERGQVVAALAKDARIARVAVDVITARPDASFVAPLVTFIPTILAEDVYMKHAAKIALRNCLDTPGGWAEAVRVQPAKPGANPETFRPLVEAVLGTKSPEILDGMTGHLKFGLVPDDRLPDLGRMFGKRGSISQCAQLMSWIQDNPYVLRSASAVRGGVGILRGMQESGRKIDPSKAGDFSWFVTSARLGLSTTIGKKPGVAEASVELARELRKLFPQELPFEVTLQRVRLDELAVGDLGRRGQVAEVFALLGDRTLRAELLKWLPSSRLPAEARGRVVLALLSYAPVANELIAAKDAFKTASYSFALTLAVGLAGDKFGADLLLAAVKAGEAPARLLQEKAVLDRLRATKVPDLDKQVAELTRGILPPDKRIEDLIKKRAAGFRKGAFDAAKGQAVFKKSCAICHQVNNEGAKVGPQLDGVGIRGLERLLEDTLDPNRNVDGAFKSTTLILADGRSPTGLVRLDGNVYVLIDGEGKENRIPKGDVDRVVASNLSAMPANVDSTVSETDYFHLLAYLLQQRPK